MNKFSTIAASALVLSMTLAPTARARDGFYLAARGGLVWNNFNKKKDAVTEKSKTSIGRVEEFSAAIGYRYKFFRGEFEFINRADGDEDLYDPDDGHKIAELSLASNSYMFNGYVDFLPNYWISPFITGGLGWSKIELKNKDVGIFATTSKWKKSSFTWQAGAGLSIRLNKCLNIDTGYRYWTLGKIRNGEVNAHEWFAGIRFTF